jgi:hypothetical protein
MTKEQIIEEVKKDLEEAKRLCRESQGDAHMVSKYDAMAFCLSSLLKRVQA